MPEATLYWGPLRDVEIPVVLEILDCGAARIPCRECEGRGVWDYMEPEIAASPCVACKGTGWILISGP